MNRLRISIAPMLGALAVASLLVLGSLSTAHAKEFVIGVQCDRSGPTQNVGAFLCDGSIDYIKLFNKKQELGPGNSIRWFEIEHAYNVPRGMEAYERQKEAGALSISIYGTPHTKALTPKLAEDHILGTSPGFGSADGANGLEYPYLFPVAASYWSQAGAAVKFVLDQAKKEGKSPKDLKIAYLFYDNPAGREPLPVFEAIQKIEGFKFQTYAIPPPGVEMRPQVLDIARNYKADWVIAHIFGRGPSVSIKELSRVRFPIDHLISFVWGSGESDVDAAGWDTAQGYYGLELVGVGENHKILQEIRDMYKAEGKPEPEAMAKTVYYNRGVAWAAIHARALQIAVKKYGNNVTSEQVKEGMESIHDFTLEGLLPPIEMSKKDHEGGGWVRVYQVQGKKWVPVTDFFHGYRDLISKMVWGS